MSYILDEEKSLKVQIQTNAVNDQKSIHSIFFFFFQKTVLRIKRFTIQQITHTVSATEEDSGQVQRRPT
jgi:hypothetical protein